MIAVKSNRFVPAFATPIISSSWKRRTPCTTISPRIQPFSTSMSTMSDVNPARIAVITGASGGIGEQTSKGLTRTLPNLERLILCCRNVEKGEKVAQSLRNGEVAGRKITVDVVPVELASAKSTVECAGKVNEILGEKSLDLLICNAGVMACPLTFAPKESDKFEPIEQQYAVNHLSHALLTTKLLPALRKGDGGRVVFVSSIAVSISKGRKTVPLIAEKTSDVLSDSNYSRWKFYGDSKVAMSLYANVLAEKEHGVVESVSLHPGIVATELSRYLPLGRVMSVGGNPSFLTRGLMKVTGLKTPEQGAELSIELSSAPRQSLDNGAMYVAVGGKKVSDSAIPLMQNSAEREKLYNDTMAFVNAF